MTERLVIIPLEGKVCPAATNQGKKKRKRKKELKKEKIRI
jgi:hypothetical protein